MTSFKLEIMSRPKIMLRPKFKSCCIMTIQFMSQKMINFSMDPSDPKLSDPNYLAKVKFDLEVKSKQLDELEQMLTKFTVSPTPQETTYLRDNFEEIEDMVSLFIDDSINAFDELVFDEELALMGAEYSRKLRLVVDQTQSLLRNLEKVK
jgi:hypothetical protein